MKEAGQDFRQYFLIPEPKHMRFWPDRFNLDFDGSVASNISSSLLETATRQIFGSRGRIVKTNHSAPVSCELVNRKRYGLRPKRQEFFDKDDAYCLEIMASGAKILAKNAIGLRFGLMTLGQLIQQCGSDFQKMIIVDWPTLTRRGYMLALVQGHNRYMPDYAKYVVREIAKLKLNALYLYLEHSFQFPFDRDIGGRRSLTPEQARELDAFAASHGIEVIPSLNVLAHSSELLQLERYRHLGEYPAGENPETFYADQLCPTNPETLKLIKREIDILSKCFRSEIIHVGGDEAAVLGKCPRCKKLVAQKGVARLYANYFNAVQEYAGHRGKRIGIWGDMLLHHRPGQGSKNETHTVSLLNRNILVYDWHYNQGSPETLCYFNKQHRRVTACTSTHVFISNSVWPEQEINQCRLFRDCPRFGHKAGLLTNWTNYMGAHDENYWLLVCSGADIMWSCRGTKRKDMIAAFARQKYGLKGKELSRYLCALGSSQGDFWRIFGVMNSTNLRQTLYHTDNPLKFWHHYNQILPPKKVIQWKKAIQKTRLLWNAILREYDRLPRKHPYFSFLEAPLLVHEHLYQRYQMSVRLKQAYAQSALFRPDNSQAAARQLRLAAKTVEKHAGDFSPIISMSERMVKALGVERSSLFRLLNTMTNLKKLAAFLRYLAANPRPLPSFKELHDVFFERKANHYWIDREDEWGVGPKEFIRYSVTDKPWLMGPVKIKKKSR